MDDITLIGLNNTIVDLRKTIQQAKVHVIRKLIRQVDQLRNKKTNTTDATGQRHKIQNERKSQRLGTEIRILSKVKKLDAAKFILQNRESWLAELPRNLTEINNTVTNEEETNHVEKQAEQLHVEKQLQNALYDRALIRLANHAGVRKAVNLFRQKYPKWEEQLPSLLSQLGKRQREKESKAKVKRRQEERLRRKQKESGEKVQKTPTKANATNLENVDLKEELNRSDENVHQDYDSDASETSDVNEDLSETQGSPETNPAESNLKKFPQTYRQYKPDLQEQTAVEKVNQRQNASDYISHQNSEKIADDTKCFPERRDGEMVITRIDLNRPDDISREYNESDSEVVTQHLSSEKESVGNVMKDSFFLGGVSGSESEAENEQKERQDKSFDGIGAYAKRNDFFQGGEKSNNQTSMLSRDKRKEKDRKDLKNALEKTRIDTTLKYKSRGMISYDNSRNYSREGGQSKRGVYNERKSKDRSFGSNATSTKGHEKGLHPSWAAKRHLASSQISVHSMGKKTTFDDDGEQESTVTQNYAKDRSSSKSALRDAFAGSSISLHPSWAAKKDQQKGIQQFKGTKIVFNDDD